MDGAVDLGRYGREAIDRIFPIEGELKMPFFLEDENPEEILEDAESSPMNSYETVCMLHEVEDMLDRFDQSKIPSSLMRDFRRSIHIMLKYQQEEEDD